MYTVLTVYIGMEIKVDAGYCWEKKNAYLGSSCFNRQAVYERNLE